MTYQVRGNQLYSRCHSRRARSSLLSLALFLSVEFYLATSFPFLIVFYRSIVLPDASPGIVIVWIWTLVARRKSYVIASLRIVVIALAARHDMSACM